MAPPFDLPRAPWLGVPPPRTSSKLESACTPHAIFTFRRRRGRLFGSGRGRATRVFLASVSWVDGDGVPAPSHSTTSLEADDSAVAELHSVDPAISAQQAGVVPPGRDYGDGARRRDGEKDAPGLTAVDGSAEKGVSAEDDAGAECPALLSAGAPGVPGPSAPARTARMTATRAATRAATTTTTATATEGAAPSVVEAAASTSPPPTYTLTRGELVRAAVLLGRRYWLIQEGRRRCVAKLAGEAKNLGEDQLTTLAHVQCLTAHAADVRAALVPMLEGAHVLRVWEAAAEDALNATPPGESSSSSSARSRRENRGAPWTLPPMPAFTVPIPTTVPITLDAEVCTPRLSPAHKAAFAHALALRDAPDLPPIHELPGILKSQYDGSKGFAWFPPDPDKVVQYDDN